MNKYRILDHNQNDLQDEHRTIRSAVDRIISHYPHNEHPYYVAAAEGNLVRLVYAGGTWE